MNKIFTFLAASIIAVSLQAQTTVEVSTGAAYANEAYYSFTDGIVSTSDRLAWDIAFPTNRYGIGVLANNGANVELYTYPDGDLSAWNSVDISNIAAWQQMFNSIENWTDGAFVQNQDESSQFDYGWGQYNMGNHHITGDSIYVIKTTAGNYKKLAILDKDPNQGGNSWEFKYANIDGSNEQIITLEADPYTDKNFISFSLETDQIVENEPASNAWELVFTKYYDYTIPYYVTGVLSNGSRVMLQEVDAVSSATYEAYEEDNFVDNISCIGSDWKSFDMGSMSYVLDEDRVFFAKVMNETYTDSSYWKLYFTDFSGSSEGKYTFVQKQLGTSSSINERAEAFMVEVFPNPAKDIVNIVFDINAKSEISLMDITGKIVHKQEILNTGFTQETVDISDLNPGIYTMTLKSEGSLVSRKVIKF